MEIRVQQTSGFGLIEILVTLGLISVGIVGVLRLHTLAAKQGVENSIRTEALAIVQSRIEEVRNYTGKLRSRSEYDIVFPDTGGFSNSVPIVGVNATFTRSEKVESSDELGALKTLTVRVSWQTAAGEPQSLEVETGLTWLSPLNIGDIAARFTRFLVAPTGDARREVDELPLDAVTTSNSDGTALYRRGADLVLVADNRMVLALPKACDTGSGACADFATITGRIWIDTASKSELSPGAVRVIASGASFCSTYFKSNGNIIPVTELTRNALTTPSGDYVYFDYTCYVGSGWYGNVGVLLANGSTDHDRICIGDPLATDMGKKPVVASRRHYRGMLYRHDAGTSTGKEEVTTATGGTTIRYYSHGIAGGIELSAALPDQVSHDFVIGSFPQDPVDGSNCESQGIMTRTDAAVDGTSAALFAGMPGAFVCLNDAYLDEYDPEVFGSSGSCPYEPSGSSLPDQEFP